MISKKFFSSTIIYTLAGALPLVSGLILIPFYIAELDETNFGLLTLYITITLFFQGIILFATEQKTAVDYFHYKDNAIRQQQVLSTNLIWGVGFALLFSILFMAWGYFFGDSILARNDLQLHPYLWMCILTSLCNALFKQYSYFLIYESKPIEYLLANVINFIATIGISLYGLYHFGNSLEGPMLGRLYSGLIILVLSIIYFNRHIGFHFDRSEGKQILHFIWPVLLYFIFTWISSYADRFIVKHYLDTDRMGIFDFVVKCTMGSEFILTGLVTVVYPKVYHFFKNPDNLPPQETNRQINLYFNGMVGAVFLGVLFTLVAVPPIADIFIHKVNYTNALIYLPILGVSVLLRILFYVYYAPVVYFKKTKLLPLNLAVSSAIQIVLSILLISWFGLMGAVVAFAVSRLVVSLVFYISARKIHFFQFDAAKQLIFPIVAMLICIVFCLLDWTNYWHVLVLCAVLSLVFFLFFRNEIKNIRVIRKMLQRF